MSSLYLRAATLTSLTVQTGLIKGVPSSFIDCSNPFLPITISRTFDADLPIEERNYFLQSIQTADGPFADNYFRLFFEKNGDNIVPSSYNGLVDRDRLLHGRIPINSSLDIREVFAFVFNGVNP